MKCKRIDGARCATMLRTRYLMLCPRCKAVYGPGFSWCPVCEVELVDQLPPAELVIIRHYEKSLDAELAKSVLEAAGIDSMIRQRHWSHNNYGLAFSPRIQLLVRVEDVEDAEKILDMDVTAEDEGAPPS